MDKIVDTSVPKARPRTVAAPMELTAEFQESLKEIELLKEVASISNLEERLANWGSD